MTAGIILTADARLAGLLPAATGLERSDVHTANPGSDDAIAAGDVRRRSDMDRTSAAETR